jgi:hypothetical protein
MNDALIRDIVWALNGSPCPTLNTMTGGWWQGRLVTLEIVTVAARNDPRRVDLRVTVLPAAPALEPQQLATRREELNALLSAGKTPPRLAAGARRMLSVLDSSQADDVDVTQLDGVLFGLDILDAQGAAPTDPDAAGFYAGCFTRGGCVMRGLPAGRYAFDVFAVPALPTPDPGTPQLRFGSTPGGLLTMRMDTDIEGRRQFEYATPSPPLRHWIESGHDEDIVAEIALCAASGETVHRIECPFPFEKAVTQMAGLGCSTDLGMAFCIRRKTRTGT